MGKFRGFEDILRFIINTINIMGWSIVFLALIVVPLSCILGIILGPILF